MPKWVLIGGGLWMTIVVGVIAALYHHVPEEVDVDELEPDPEYGYGVPTARKFPLPRRTFAARVYREIGALNEVLDPALQISEGDQRLGEPVEGTGAVREAAGPPPIDLRVEPAVAEAV